MPGLGKWGRQQGKGKTNVPSVKMSSPQASKGIFRLSFNLFIGGFILKSSRECQAAALTASVPLSKGPGRLTARHTQAAVGGRGALRAAGPHRAPGPGPGTPGEAAPER